MKTQLSAFAISVMIITTGISSTAENSVNPTINVKAGYVQGPVFTSFSTHRQGKGIALTWSVESTAGVVNFTIQKTYEDVTDPYAVWEDVTSLPEDGSRSYKFTDDNVFPGFISYRITATLIDGTTAQSGISTVQIVSR